MLLIIFSFVLSVHTEHIPIMVLCVSTSNIHVTASLLLDYTLFLTPNILFNEILKI